MTSSSNTTTTDTPPEGTTGEIERQRQILHNVDMRIVDLIRQRIAVSRVVQGLKSQAGLPRVDLAQERRIIQYYTDNFGAEGAVLAIHLLELAKSDITV